MNGEIEGRNKDEEEKAQQKQAHVGMREIYRHLNGKNKG